MKQMVGGAIAIILGFLGFSFFFSDFLTFLAGIIPILLLAGGGLAIYLNYESESSKDEAVTDSWDDTRVKETPSPAIPEKKMPEENISDKSGGDTPKLSGNTDSHVFHSSDCEFSKSKKCTAVFTDREEAIKEGYKPCGICKP